MKIQNIVCLLALFFVLALNNCRADTALDIPLKDALDRVKNGDIGFIIDAVPARVTELSKIHTALPFYAALLLEAADAGNERIELLLLEALKDPATRDAALKKLSPVREEAEVGEQFDGIAAARAALARRDYNEALRLFGEMRSNGYAAFIADKELLGDLGKAFQYAVIPGRGAAAAVGAELFMEWEGDVREGSSLWALPENERDERRYLLLYYAGRMRRQLAEYDAAVELFASALVLAPDEEQADACIWYIIDTSLAKNGGKTEETTALIKRYALFWKNPAYFSDIFEKLTHLLCLNQRWNEVAELFPYIRSYSNREIYAKYAFILGNAVELGLLTPEKASASLKPIHSGSDRAEPADSPLPADFYRIAYDSGIVAGLDTRSFYYTSAAAEKLGKEPRLNIPEDGAGGVKQSSQAERELTNEFLYGFFLFGAARFAYPYIMEQAAELSVQELRVLAELLAAEERWAESIRLARTYMQRPDYILNHADIGICYPLAYYNLVEKFSRETGMDEALLYGLIRTESLFMPDIVSRAGAAGLTQLMPETAQETARGLARSGGTDYFTEGGLDLSEPALNINLGALYFQRLKEQTDSTLLALLSYNGGMNRIRRWRNARPALNDELFLESIEYAETRDYGRQVLTAAAIYRRLWKL
ncbi:MAG: lytic transglycosylase domain-containing protein [Spirochaetaceae bacterium]|jgi:soluble lytic murein transglycosylase|nr:lytic transglycosylase domain-containing protein [Spirochaetaceae bacterium]